MAAENKHYFKTEQAAQMFQSEKIFFIQVFILAELSMNDKKRSVIHLAAKLF